MIIDAVSAPRSQSLNMSVGPALGESAPSDGVGFEQALGQAIGSAVDALNTGEAVAIQGVEGAVAPMKVVESVMEAQRSLQSVLAIRDKIVSAYQEIARMPI
jgi:flagellar hook-basal body complex protein FliE